MSLYFRRDTGTTYENFNSMREAGMLMIGQMERQLARSSANKIPLTPGMVKDFQDLLDHYRRWWTSLEEKPNTAVIRPFKLVAKPSPPS